jgi:RNA-directed DNA polymerase
MNDANLHITNSKKVLRLLAEGNVFILCKYLRLNPLLVETGIVEKKYTTFSIRKKSGGKRTIEMPEEPLMQVQKIFAKFLSETYNYIITDSAYGFIASDGLSERKNIITNAKNHVGNKYLFNIDISNFFPSINANMIKDALINCPLSVNEELASYITLLSTNNWHLPVGSPTSPVLSNFVFYATDLKIEQWAQMNNVVFTRYADDLSFSKNTPFTVEDKNEISAIVLAAGFLINKRKRRLQTQYQAQWVTGIKVNEKLNVDRRIIKKVRAMLHDWQKNGLVMAAKRFSNKNTANLNLNSFVENLRGNISFIADVRGKDDKVVVQKYQNIFTLLVERDCVEPDICPF